MQLFSRLTIAGALALVGFTAAASSDIEARQTTTQVALCTDAHYGGSGCPYDIPDYGTGSCALLHLTGGICYNWDSFPDVDVEPLVNNLTFVGIQCCYSVLSCELYKTSDCTGDSRYVGPGETDLSCATGVDTSFNDAVNSFYCTSG